MIISFPLAFFRLTIGFVFAISLVGKIRNIPLFTRTITNFNFFPKSFSKPLTYLFLLGEFGTVVAMIVGGSFLFWGFLTSTLLYLSFSIALLSVVIRKIKTPCNCFGPDEKDVGIGHVVRSTGFMICGLGGLISMKFYELASGALNWAEWGLVGATALVFVLVWIQISEIVKLFIPESGHTHLRTS